MATRTDTPSPAQHAADSHALIRGHGARVNNLKGVSIEIPKRRLTVFTGVSGSGKSSLVFGTIAAVDPHSTVGTTTDANALLRILFSRLGEPHIGSPNAFPLSRCSTRSTSSWRSGWASCRSTGRRPRCRAARRSAPR